MCFALSHYIFGKLLQQQQETNTEILGEGSQDQEGELGVSPWGAVSQSLALGDLLMLSNGKNQVSWLIHKKFQGSTLG